jgi:hypothetical protein
MQAGHRAINNDSYWCNANNHGNGCNCWDNKDHDNKLGRGSVATAVAVEAWWWCWQQQE